MGFHRERDFPTDEHRRQVETMSALGLSVEKMSLIIRDPVSNKPLSRQQFVAHFEDEIELGRAQTDLRVFTKLLDVIEHGASEGAIVQAVMFYLRNRVPGFNPTERHEHMVEGKSGVLVAPAMLDPEDWIEQQERANASKVGPEGTAAIDELLS